MKAINFSNKLNFWRISILFIAFIIFLNPYFAGSLSLISGQILVIFLLSAYFFKKIIINKYNLLINFKFINIALIVLIYPHIVFFLTEAKVDFGLIRTQISIFAMILFGFSIAAEFMRSHEQDSVVLFICNIFTTIISINSVIILLEFYFPEIRVFVESFLISDTKVDYSNGLRFRGLASAGGASLSLAHGISIPLSYYLYKQNNIGPLRLFLTVTIIFISLIFIGRTGIIIAVIGIICVTFFSKSRLKEAKFFSKLWLYIVGIAALALISFAGTFFNSLPDFYQNYSLNLFLGGSESLKSEGTINTVIAFYDFPQSISKIIFGTGNFSGGYDYGYDWPGDPGIMKMLTSYGIFGILFYPLLLVGVFCLPKGSLRDILIICSVLLVFSEIKEPFIFKGYTSRFFWLLIGISLYQMHIFQFKKLIRVR